MFFFSFNIYLLDPSIFMTFGIFVYNGYSISAWGYANTKSICSIYHSFNIAIVSTSLTENQYTTGAYVSKKLIPYSCCPPCRLRRSFYLCTFCVLMSRLLFMDHTESIIFLSLGYLVLIYDFPMASLAVIIELFLHGLEKLFSVRCLHSLVIVHCIIGCIDDEVNGFSHFVLKVIVILM